MALSIYQVTKSKSLRKMLRDILQLVSNAELVRGGKHCALSIGRRKIPISSTPSCNERKLVLNFRKQVIDAMVLDGLDVSSL